MFPSDLRARKEWRLPLVGGAEISRLSSSAEKWEVVVFTSKPYPIMDTVYLSPTYSLANTLLLPTPDPVDYTAPSYALEGVTLQDTVVFHSTLDTSGFTYSINAVSILDVIVSYRTADAAGFVYSINSVELLRGLVFYTTWTPEVLSTTYALTGVTLL